MIMLDTNVCVYIIKGQAPWAEQFFLSDNREFCISSLVAYELQVWRAGAEPGGALEQLISAFLEGMPIVAFGQSEAAVGGEVSKRLLDLRIKIGAIEPLIAAHAMSSGALLVTDNQKDFGQIEGLRYATSL